MRTRKPKRAVRGDRFIPTPEETFAVSKLLETQTRYRTNPRGQVYEVSPGCEFCDRHVKYLQYFSRLAVFNLYDPLVTCPGLSASGLEIAMTLPRLTAVALEFQHNIPNQITQYVAKNCKIKWLHLVSLNLNDDSLEPLAKMTQLLKLSLNCNPISDRGLTSLKDLSNLRWLFLQETNTSQHGAEKLRESLPNCKIKL